MWYWTVTKVNKNLPQNLKKQRETKQKIDFLLKTFHRSGVFWSFNIVIRQAIRLSYEIHRSDNWSRVDPLFTPDPPHYLLWVRFSNSENTDLLVEFFRDRKVENDGRKSTKPQSIGVTITWVVLLKKQHILLGVSLRIVTEPS